MKNSLLIFFLFFFTTSNAEVKQKRDSLIAVWQNKTLDNENRFDAWLELTNSGPLDQDMVTYFQVFFDEFGESEEAKYMAYANYAKGMLKYLLRGDDKSIGVKLFKTGIQTAEAANLQEIAAVGQAHLANMLFRLKEDSAQFYLDKSLDYLLNHSPGELPSSLLYGRLDKYVFSLHMAYKVDTEQSLMVYKEFSSYLNKHEQYVDEIDVLEATANFAWQNLKNRDEALIAAEKAIQRIQETTNDSAKREEIEVMVMGFKTGSSRRISNEIYKGTIIPCKQPKPILATFTDPQAYSSGHYPLKLVDSIPNFLSRATPKTFDSKPQIYKGNIDSSLAGIPEVRNALPGVYIDNGGIDLKSYTISQGLPDNNTSHIDQDQHGNYWISSGSGLIKYDGLNYYIYGYEQGLIETLGPLLVDNKGFIWIGTMNGVIKFDGTYFIRYTNCFKVNAFVLTEDKNGNVWSCHTNGGRGMAKYTDDGVEVWSNLNGLANKINALAFINSEQAWIGTELDGLFYRNGDKVSQFTSKHGLPGHAIHNVIVDNTGSLWFICQNYNTFQVWLVKIEKGTLFIYNLYEGNREISLIKSKKGGIWSVDNKKLVKIKGDSYTKYDIPKATMRGASFEDKQNNIWVGSTNGLLKLREGIVKNVPLSENAISILHHKEHAFWTIYRTEGAKLKENGILKTLNLNGRASSAVNCHLYDSKGRYWIGTHGKGLYMYDGELLYHYDNSSNIPNAWVMDLLEDHEGNIWFTTLGKGAVKFDGENFTAFLPKENYTKGMIVPSLFSLFEASDSTFWFSAIFEGGICNLKNGKYTYYKNADGFPSGVVSDFTEDKDGAIWAVGDNISIRILDGKCEIQSTEDGFPERSTSSSIKDDLGNLWFAHQNYISVLSNGSYITFDKQDGFKGAGTFTAISDITKDSDGILWFGSSPPAYIDPNEFFEKSTSTKPTLVLNEVLLQNKRVHYRELLQSDSAHLTSKYSKVQFEGVLPFSNVPTKLILPYNINEIFFQFTGYDDAAQHKIKTTYRLEGLTNGWSTPSFNFSAKYTNLDYGDYCFVAKAQNQYGNWSDELRFEFTITPPWWHTWWARALYLLGGVLILTLFYRWRTASLKQRQKELEQEVKIATAEMREQKEKAEKSEAFKQQFLANMSHEIRTPMNAVMGMTNLVLDTKLEEKQKFYLTGIQKSSENLLHIINDILDLSKIEAGKMELEEIDFSITDVVDQVKQTIQHKADEKGLELIVTIDSDVTNVVLGDPTRLNQVLINLANNAIKFTEKGSVNIIVSSIEKGIRFSVNDTGIGIPKEKLQTIFENFSQANASDTRKYGGTGLGLSISKQLVELMGSRIAIESIEGSGTTFSFNLKFKEGSVEKLEERLAIEKSVDGSILDGLKILVTDDNEYNRIVARDTLMSKAKVEVHEAENGAEAVNLVSKMDFDVILMDVQMPVMNGYFATKAIRAMNNSKKDTPIIALTASVLRLDLDKCTKAGMNSYIPKPFKPQDLIIGIAQTLKIALKVKKENIKEKSQLKVDKAKAFEFTNLNYLKEFCEGDKEKMKRYIAIFIKSAPVLIDTLSKAIEEADMTKIANQVHGFKTKLVMMGMSETKDLSIRLESLCRKKPKSKEIQDMVEEFKGNINKALVELNDAVK